MPEITKSVKFEQLYRSSGLGFGTVRELLKAGAYVSILDKVQPPDLKDSRVLFVQTDITKIPEVQNVVDRTVAWTQQTGAVLGGVINCAGIGTPAKVISMPQTCFGLVDF